MSATTVNVLSNFGSVGAKAGAQGLGLAGISAGPAGLIASAGVGAISAIVGVVAHHSAAVKTEAQALNAAVPAFNTQVQIIMARCNAGQLSPMEAGFQIDQAVQDFYSYVAPIIKKSSPCSIGEDCTQPTNSKGLPPFTPCNGPCAIGCVAIESTACKAKKLLAQGGTITIPTSPSGGNGYMGYASFVLSYGGGGVGGVNWSQASAGAPFGGTVPQSTAFVGTPIGATGVVVPYSQAANAQLQLNATPSLLSAIVPTTSGGKILLAGVAIVALLLFAATR